MNKENYKLNIVGDPGNDLITLTKKEYIKYLEGLLRNAIEEEEYEKCCRYRDIIRDIKGEM